MASEDSAGPLPVRFLNDSYGLQVQHSQRFSLFPTLPPEICVGIWHSYLWHHRIVGIDLHAESDAGLEDGDGASQSSEALPLYSETNELGNVASGQDYRIVLSSQHQLSPLLRVNAKARAVALGFYRLQLPCSSRPRPSQDSHDHERRVYVSPEFDFVHVQFDPGPVRRGQAQRLPRPPPERLADFLHDCKAYDPRGRGLLNLVVGNDDTSRFHLPHNPLLVAPQALDAFTSTLVNLQTLYFYIRADAARRREERARGVNVDGVSVDVERRGTTLGNVDAAQVNAGHVELGVIHDVLRECRRGGGRPGPGKKQDCPAEGNSCGGAVASSA